MMNRKEILETAIKTVCEERQDSYGKPEDNFAIIADLWSGYLGDVILEAEDVAIMMILLKIARIQTGTFKPDNYIDIAGYAACAAEVAGGAETEPVMPAPMAADQQEDKAEVMAELKKKCDPAPKTGARRKAGWTLEKIADEMGCSIQTVANRLNKEAQ
jgi:hypothetical protein